jgi:N-acetylglutamate synthase-like GNAT family acetyltransferase
MPTKSERIDWTVRPTNAGDKEAVETLLHASYGNLLSKDYDANLLKIAVPNLCHARLDLLTCSTWYVVEDPETGKIVGCGGWTPKSPFGEDVPHLRHFATDPDHLRKGVARALWDRTWNDWCKYSDKKDMPAMEVFSTLTAESFYASLGFERVERITIPIREDCPFPAILMRRPGSISN